MAFPVLDAAPSGDAMTKRVLGLIAIVLVSSLAPAALAAEGDASAAADSSVSFETDGTAIVDYAVSGDTVAESIRVQSQQEAEAALSLSVGADLSAVSGLAGSTLSVDASSGLQTTIRAESGATISAHENSKGSLVVASDGEPQYVEVGLAESTSVRAESESRVVVTTGNGTAGAFLATGDGSVTVNEDGNVTASVEGDGRLVFRAYPDGRDDADERVESLIASGEAAASVYLTGEGSGTVNYGGDTAVSVAQRTDGQVTMTVNRSSHEGTVVVTSVAEGTFQSAEDVQVSVDGQAAARASSMADLRRAANGGETSKFLVRGGASADASMDVLVGVNHFSSREVTLSDDGSASSGGGESNSGGEGSGTGDDAATGGAGPGFGVLGALAALVAAATLLIRR